MSDEYRTECIAVLGPTCSWKSSTALLLAVTLKAEIVGCDSMQIYRGMTVGTAAPRPARMNDVPHHLVGSVPVDQSYDVNRYVKDAQRVLDDLATQRKTAVLCGGSGLYAKALIYGFRMPPADEDLNQQLLNRSGTEQGRARLVAELAEHAGNETIPEQVRLNPRRLVRAVEILRLTGVPPWEQQTHFARAREGFRQFIILPEMSVLRPRIEARTRQMIESGWIEETRQLMKQGLFDTPTARQALGYRQVARFLHGDIPSIDALCECLIRTTVRYARRQRTWFRNQHPGACRMTVKRITTAEELCDTILRQLREQRRDDGSSCAPEILID